MGIVVPINGALYERRAAFSLEEQQQEDRNDDASQDRYEQSRRKDAGIVAVVMASFAFFGCERCHRALPPPIFGMLQVVP